MWLLAMSATKIIYEIVDVKTYDGYKPSERPTGFAYEGVEHHVVEILDRWYEASRIAGRPTYDYFKVRSDKGGVYILRHNRMHDVWSVLIG